LETKTVQRFGNSGHIVLPKEYIGKRIRFIAEPRSLDGITAEALEILKPYLERILGIYLYGSYARKEADMESDVDILAITDTKLKIMEKASDFSIVSVTLQEIENALENNAVLMLPIIKEARPIINPNLIERYGKYKFTRKNTKLFIENTSRILELNKRGMELNFEIGSLVYSLLLRIRSLLMIKLINDNGRYTKSFLFAYLGNNGLERGTIDELYKIYASERKNIKIRESAVVTKKDIYTLIEICEMTLQEIKRSLT